MSSGSGMLVLSAKFTLLNLFFCLTGVLSLVKQEITMSNHEYRWTLYVGENYFTKF